MLSIVYGQTTDNIKMSEKLELPTKKPGRTVSLFVIYCVEFACKWSSQVRVNESGLKVGLGTEFEINNLPSLLTYSR